MKLGLVKSSVCVAAVSLLAACAPFGKQSPLDETTAYPLPQGQSAATAQDGWWMKLKDKKLNNLIASAIQTSTNLRVVKARFEQAQAQLGVVGAANKPQVGLGVTGLGAYVSPKPQAGMVDTDHTLVWRTQPCKVAWFLTFGVKTESRFKPFWEKAGQRYMKRSTSAPSWLMPLLPNILRGRWRQNNWRC